MKHNINIYLLLVLSLFTGVTYAARSLWGESDEPQANQPVTAPTVPTAPTAATAPTAPVKPAVVQAPAQVVAQPVVVDTAAIEVKQADLKPTCEVLRNQTVLDANVMRSPAMQDALRNNLQLAPAAYKALFANTASINMMYQQYRTQYLKKYCN